MKKHPPHLAHRILLQFLREDLAEDVSGDLEEKYYEYLKTKTPLRAKLGYWYEVLHYLRPFAIKKLKRTTPNVMYRSYFKSAFRNLKRSKLLASINIAGLSVGMAVALAIGLWIYDELTFDKGHRHHDRIAQVIQNVTNNGEVQTWTAIPWPLADELRKNYGSDFEQVVLTTSSYPHLLTTENKKLTKTGMFSEPGFDELFSINVIKGSAKGMNDPSSMLLSASAAKAYFGDEDPINQVLKLDDQYTAKVAGVYNDFPFNSTFAGTDFLASWEMLHNDVRGMEDPWRPNAFFLYVRLTDQADFKSTSLRIKDAKLKRVNEQLAKKKPALFLHPMDQWHLYSEFQNGHNIGGRIRYVWLFGIIGLFVLLMACINFMNLTTARSEQRAKEVGIRKTIGSLRSQLIAQFFCESTLVALFSLVLSLLLVRLALPFFNQITDKQIVMPLTSPVFWGIALGFSFLTGTICGSYPALYLSSIQPGKALKGSYRSGRSAGLSRKALVVLQFTISVILIVGTVTVFQQVRFAQARPIGYNRNALITSPVVNKSIHEHFNAFRSELEKTGAIVSMAEAGAAPTQGEGSSSGFDWRGKDPNLSIDFNFFGASAGYGKTVGWEVKAGRDFSADIVSDSGAVILNESAVSYMGLKEPVGETIRWWGHPQIVIGVIRDIIFNSPYEPVRPSVYFMRRDPGNVIVMRLNPEKGPIEAIASIEKIFKQYIPDEPFTYQFTDTEYARKFGNEDRIGKLAAVFTLLAIVISCLGIFALSSFEAEQRTKEIGIRKVLGASVFGLWKMLSGNFVLLAMISCLVAVPVAYLGLNSWLTNFNYRTAFPWWTFGVASAATLLITLFTVSYHTLHAANSKPAQSLRAE